MKIFFTYKRKGSLDVAENHSKIEDFLKNYGTIISKDIRSKSIGLNGEELNNNQILQRNLDLIRSSDVLIADVSNPSLGVGYQIHFAKTLNKKIICLYQLQVKKDLSPIIDGDEYLEILKFNNVEEIFTKLGNILYKIESD